MNINEALKKLSEGKNLKRADAKSVLDLFMEGQGSPAQLGGFLMALRVKGETVDEITGAAESLRSHAISVKAPPGALDTCGTGGDGSGTFNASPAAALIAAGAGVPVAKHGNKAMSSSCGSADLFAQMGVRLDPGPKALEQSLRKAGIAFLFAQALHPAMKHVGPTRRELGVRTMFNLLGPLANPAKVRFQMMGVADAKLMEPLSKVMKGLGVQRAWLVHGKGGLDEISLSGPTRVMELHKGRRRKFSLSPKSLGLPSCSIKALKGGDAQKNAAIMEGVLRGKKGPYRNFSVANAAGALMVAGRCSKLRQAVALAQDSLDSGRARRCLEAMVQASQA